MKVMKLDDKMKAINICDGGERCQAGWGSYPDKENSLKQKGEMLTILKTMFPVQENVNIVQLKM